MQSSFPDRIAALQSASQDALGTFLTIDIDLAFSMLEVGRAEQIIEHRNTALNNARGALNAIRHFEGRIADPKIWRTIHARADELEAAIVAFGPGQSRTADGC